MKHNIKHSVQIVEVGLRDGLQNEKLVLPSADRIELARRLIDCGVRRMELGAFVRKEKVPQMAGTKEVVDAILHEFADKKTGPRALRPSVLVPNEIGMQEALHTAIPEVAIFTATSETFSQKNINCSITESLQRFTPVLQLAKKNKIKVRGYLSTCFGCPYEGRIAPQKVVQLAKKLLQLGCYEVSIGDTIGVAVPSEIRRVFRLLKKEIPIQNLAGHFHDTRGMASANIFAAFEEGVRIFDSSLGGLGGCPYAPGSAGNVATEDVVYLLDGMGIKTGIDLPRLVELHAWLAQKMGKELPSRVGKAGPRKF